MTGIFKRRTKKKRVDGNLGNKNLNRDTEALSDEIHSFIMKRSLDSDDPERDALREKTNALVEKYNLVDVDIEISIGLKVTHHDGNAPMTAEEVDTAEKISGSLQKDLDKALRRKQHGKKPN